MGVPQEDKDEADRICLSIMRSFSDYSTNIGEFEKAYKNILGKTDKYAGDTQ